MGIGMGGDPGVGYEAVKIPGLRPGMVGVAAVRYEDFGGAAPGAGLRPVRGYALVRPTPWHGAAPHYLRSKNEVAPSLRRQPQKG